jgi:hypothetical protein
MLSSLRGRYSSVPLQPVRHRGVSRELQTSSIHPYFVSVCLTNQRFCQWMSCFLPPLYSLRLLCLSGHRPSHHDDTIWSSCEYDRVGLSLPSCSLYCSQWVLIHAPIQKRPVSIFGRNAKYYYLYAPINKKGPDHRRRSAEMD